MKADEFNNISRKLTPADVIDIGGKLDAVQDDSTPFLMTAEDGKEKEVLVVGDANKTELKKRSYKIVFRFSKEELSKFFAQVPEDAWEKSGFYFLEVEYGDVFVTPRNNLKVVDSIMKIQPFFNRLKEDGGIEKFGSEELLSMYVAAGDQLNNAIYNIVATFLKISDELGEYMMPGSVLNTFYNILDNNPEVFNEAEVFF